MRRKTKTTAPVAGREPGSRCTVRDSRGHRTTGWAPALLCGLLATLGLACGTQVESEPGETPGGPHSTAPGTDAPERLVTARGQDESAENQQRIDPNQDGWDTEALAESVGHILKEIAHGIEAEHPITGEALASLASPDVKGTALVPKDLQTAFDDPPIRVRRAVEANLASAPSAWRGLSGLAQTLEELRVGLMQGRERHTKLKVVRIEATPDGAVTDVSYQDQVLHPTGASQRNATWRMGWSGTAESLKLSEVELCQYEHVETQTAGTTLLQDCTESLLGGEPVFDDQLRHGSAYWAARLEGFYSRTLLEAHMGVSVGDVNGDDLEDIYVCQPGGLPNRLLIQQPDGSVRDASADAGVDVLDVSFSSLFVDLDNDGDQDLALLTGRRLFLFEGDGQGHFSERAQHVGNFGYSLTSVDFDGDGDLDLYRCSYRRALGPDVSQFGQPAPLYNATNGGKNVLLRNDGDWKFEDVTAAAGLDANNDRWSYAAAWEDYDNDGDQDLYVANDYGHNNLYRNDAGHFLDVAPEAGALDANFGMSVSWGDMDHDGWMDLYVSNMFSAAGNRVVAQAGFKPGMTDEEKAPFLRLARGNTMLANRAQDPTSKARRFEDVSEIAGTTMGRWSWGSLFTDINNDGWDDLLVANGYLTQESTEDL